MGLFGDLKEFGIPEIFQLLDQQGKTGCLRIASEPKEVEVFFRDGKIVGAISGGENMYDHLLSILFNMGYLNEEEVEKLRKRKQRDLTNLTEILHQEGLLVPSKTNALLREHTEELIYPVFEKRKGSFSFVQDQTLPEDLELQEPLAPEPIILEGLRKSDEMPMLKKKLGSFQEIPQRQYAGEVKKASKKSKAAAKEDDEWPGMEEVLGEEDDFLSHEKIIFEFVDGKRSIYEIIQVAPFGQFTTCQALLSLLNQGRIRLTRPEVRFYKMQRRSLFGKADLIKGSFAVLGLLAVVMQLHYLINNSDEKKEQKVPFFDKLIPVYQLINQPREEHVAQALEIYKMEQGTYPDELSSLVEAKLLFENNLLLWGDNRFYYQYDPENGYSLKIVPAD